TDADGLAELDNVAPGCDRMRVVAERFEPASVALPPESPREPIEVTLPGCASIELSIATADGSARDGLRLYWIAPRTPTPLAAGSESDRNGVSDGARIDGHGGFEYHTETHPDGTASCDIFATVPARTGGPFRLGCLAAGAPVVVHVLDRTGFAIWSQRGILLAP